MANPHKGEVGVKFPNAVKEGYLVPKRPITLKFDMNAMADAEREFKGNKTIAGILNNLEDDPLSMSLDDVRILLSYGLRHQFPSINRVIAGNILNVESFEYVATKIMESLSLGMKGNLISKEDFEKGGDFVRGAEEAGDVTGAVEDGEVGEKN